MMEINVENKKQICVNLKKESYAVFYNNHELEMSTFFHKCNSQSKMQDYCCNSDLELFICSQSCTSCSRDDCASFLLCEAILSLQPLNC